ncbi:hypothetical protein ANO11243_092860 [Dothideomycetidae sp. 11243]|nr:hypothetical protein ANO11243_092860 [fungal sp. No.11243]
MQPLALFVVSALIGGGYAASTANQIFTLNGCSMSCKLNALSGSYCGIGVKLGKPKTLQANVPASSLQQCLAACFGNAKCMSFEFGPKSTCTLFSDTVVNQRAQLTSSNAALYYDRACYTCTATSCGQPMTVTDTTTVPGPTQYIVSTITLPPVTVTRVKTKTTTVDVTIIDWMTDVVTDYVPTTVTDEVTMTDTMAFTETDYVSFTDIESYTDFITENYSFTDYVTDVEACTETETAAPVTEVYTDYQTVTAEPAAQTSSA